MRCLLWLGLSGCVDGSNKVDGVSDSGAEITNDSEDLEITDDPDDSGGSIDSGDTDDCPATEVSGDLPLYVLEIDVLGQGDDYETPTGPEGPNDEKKHDREEVTGDEDLAFRYTPVGVEDDMLSIEFGIDLPQDMEISPEDLLSRRSWVLKDCGEDSVAYGVVGATHQINVSDGQTLTVVVEGCEGYCYLGFGVEPPVNTD